MSSSKGEDKAGDAKKKSPAKEAKVGNIEKIEIVIYLLVVLVDNSSSSYMEVCFIGR